MPNTSITGLGTFNDDSACGGEVLNAVFNNNAELLATGEVTGSATFNESSILRGTVAAATLNDSSSIETTGVVTGNATLNNSSINKGAVQGDLFLYDTASNTGTVSNNLYAVATASNTGTVTGNTVTIDHSNAHDIYWSDDSVLVVGSVLYTDRYRMDIAVSVTFTDVADGTTVVTNSSGTIVYKHRASGTVLSTEINTLQITEINQSVNNGTYDVIADGSGGSTNGNFQYTASGTVLYDDTTQYHYLSNGVGGYTQYLRTGYVIQDDAANGITINGGTYPNGTYDEVADGNGGSTTTHTYAPAGTEFYAANNISYQSNGSGGYDEVASNPAAGTVLSTPPNMTTIAEIGYAVNNGTYDVIADGAGGSTNGNYQYTANGTVIHDDTTQYHYLSNGIGGYTQYYRTGYLIQNDSVNSITINGGTYPNGTLDEVADGNGGSNLIYTYAANGTVLYDDTTQYHYLSNGVGGYTQCLRTGYLIQNDVANTITINGYNYPNGTYDEVANGSGGTTNIYTYAANGTVFTDDGTQYHYLSNGVGGYNRYLRTGYVIQNDSGNLISINGYNYGNGTFDEIADGNGGSTFSYTYAPAGYEFVSQFGISYQSDGNGGVTEVPL